MGRGLLGLAEDSTSYKILISNAEIIQRINNGPA